MASPLDEIRQQVAEVRKEQREFLKLHLPREDSNTSEGIKSLLAINGGGVVAMLGFMQALVGKQAELLNFKYHGANAMLAFCIGIIFGALVPGARVVFIKKLMEHENDDDYPAEWELAGYIFWCLSLLAFLSGVGFAAYGIKAAFLSE